MKKLQQQLAEVEQKLDRTQLEWFRSVPDPIQPPIKGWSNTQVWALAGPQLNTLHTGPDANKPVFVARQSPAPDYLSGCV